MKYDLAIIGAGPAGLMAAVRAGELGARVVLIEKNKQPGAKLLITGGGRCNLTNRLEDPQQFATRFGGSGKFLISALHKFGVKETIEFFESQGVKTKTEKDTQVFPASDKANDVLDALLSAAKRYGVIFKTGQAVLKISKQGDKIQKVILADGEEILARNYVIATGGKSYPQTGSSGDGYRWLQNLGHTIITPRPALVPLWLKETFIKELEGLSLENCLISLYQSNKKIAATQGAAIFTSVGLSGPAALDLSSQISLQPIKDLIISIDFLPQIEIQELDKKLQNILESNGNKLIKNCLTGLAKPKFIPILLKLSAIIPDKKNNAITKEERRKLAQLLKSLRLTIKTLGGYGQAIITAGGVDLKEVDPKTMRSKVITNLFLAGEILDLNGPTGGYNLQVCWTTGYVAGSNATS